MRQAVAGSCFAKLEDGVPVLYLSHQDSLGPGRTIENWRFSREAALDLAENIIGSIENADKMAERYDLEQLRTRVDKLVRIEKERFFSRW